MSRAMRNVMRDVLDERAKPLAHLFLIVCALLTIGPFVWMVLTSLKTQAESIHVPPVIVPAVWRWENYLAVFDAMPYLRFYYNSLVSTALIVAGQVVFSSMAAYAFARLRFPGRDLVFIVCLSILMVPPQLMLIPQFLIVNKLGLLNTVSALVIPNLFSVSGAFLLRQFFQGLPKELEEAAIVDGLNYFQIYWRIMLPMVKPALIAFGIIVALWSWNSLLWPLVVNTAAAKMTIPVGLASLSGRTGTEYPILMAAAVLAIIPLLVIFIVFQRQFISGLATTGIKG